MISICGGDDVMAELCACRWPRQLLPDHACHSLVGDWLARAMLGRALACPPSELHFACNPYGKPSVIGDPGLHFNLSHSGQWVVCAVHNAPIGTDVQRIGAVARATAAAALSRAEHEAMLKQPPTERAAFFTRIWTIKESYLKLLGVGMNAAFPSLTVEACGEDCFRVSAGGRALPAFCRTYGLDGQHALAVCAHDGNLPEGVLLTRFSLTSGTDFTAVR